MATATNPNRVVLIKSRMSTDKVTLWDVYTRKNRVLLGDVRKLANPSGGNPYLYSVSVEIVGGFATREAAVRSLLARVQAEIAEAEA